jgi:multiple sugar transport system permease protein
MSASTDPMQSRIGAVTVPARSTGRGRKLALAVGTHLALLIVIAAFAAPFLMTVATSFDDARRTTWPWPSEPTLEHYRELFDRRNVENALKNSLIVSLSTTALAVPAASLAGYGLSRLKFRRKTWIAYGILLLTAIPLSATMVPIYDLTRRLHLENSYQGLVLTHLAISLPLLVWLMKGYHDAIPVSQEEAAWTDGASVFRAWRDVVFPQTLSGIAVVAGFALANAWAEVLMVVILITDVSKETLPFQFFYAADRGGGQVTAALGVLYIMPVLLVFLVLRRVMIRGLVDATPV